jgi:hypothetical protein
MVSAPKYKYSANFVVPAVLSAIPSTRFKAFPVPDEALEKCLSFSVSLLPPQEKGIRLPCLMQYCSRRPWLGVAPASGWSFGDSGRDFFF